MDEQVGLLHYPSDNGLDVRVVGGGQSNNVGKGADATVQVAEARVPEICEQVAGAVGQRKKEGEEGGVGMHETG